ncbi:hypothetical protein JBL43_07015 [Aureibaculum sp. A20]|uniref:Lipoprotein n=1 Tax=Aureibaculum flavum TaxID=2795986 RepID=A0ABS0WPR7_9FLAO|nr:DUF6252 family protein [Aureibaculum flavum]MBJ2173981.1 hypothetical protein [Aureibaculum flavum]
MKTILTKTTTFILLLAVLVISCSKKDKLKSDDNYYLTAMVDGLNYSADLVTANTVLGQTDHYTISGIGNNKNIGLVIENPPSTGTFITGSGETPTLFYQEITTTAVVWWPANEELGSGTITITENNDTFIAGTFSFTGILVIDDSTKTITEGKFKAKKL